MKVVAIETGYFGGRIQNVGDTFDVKSPRELAGWMKPVKPGKAEAEAAEKATADAAEKENAAAEAGQAGAVTPDAGGDLA